MNRLEMDCPNHTPTCLTCGQRWTVPTLSAFVEEVRRAASEPTLDAFQALTWLAKKAGREVCGNYEVTVDAMVEEIRIATGNPVMSWNDALVWVEKCVR